MLKAMYYGRHIPVTDPTFWLVRADIHDYDYMSEWTVGLYDTQAGAEWAMERERERYQKANPDAKKQGLPNMSIEELRVNENKSEIEQ
jgi:hypothetical protein